MRFKHSIAVFVMLIALVTMGACSDSKPIILGFSGQLTGKLSDLGVSARNGALLAVEVINANGGIGGRPLKLVAKDDLNTPEGALAADQALVDEGAVAIIGHMTSSIGVSVMPFVNETETVMISPTMSTPRLSDIEDSFFRIIVENRIQTRELAEYARSAMDVNSVVTIAESDNNEYSFSFAESFGETFSGLGGSVLSNLTYSTSTNPTWDEIIDKLIELKPDAILLICPAHDAVAIVQRVRTAGLKLRVLSGAWAYTEKIIQWGGKYTEGMIFVIDYAADNPNPEFIKFRESYKSRFGTLPNFASTFAYEAVQALAAGLRKTDGKKEGLKEAMAPSEMIKGPIGDFRLNRYGDVERSLFIVTVKNGVFRTIEMR